MLAAISMALKARWMIRFRFGTAKPASSVTTRSVTAATTWKATIAATAATQPTRLLTGLWVPRISRKTTAATATRNPVPATLNVTFIAGCLRTTAKTKRAAAAVLRTSRLGVRRPAR